MVQLFSLVLLSCTLCTWRFSKIFKFFSLPRKGREIAKTSRSKEHARASQEQMCTYEWTWLFACPLIQGRGICLSLSLTALQRFLSHGRKERSFTKDEEEKKEGWKNGSSVQRVMICTHNLELWFYISQTKKSLSRSMLFLKKDF